MKLTKDEIINSQSIQIIANTIRIQTMLEMLIESDVLDITEFNQRVEVKYKKIGDKYGIEVNDIPKPEKTEQKYYKYFGEPGES